MRISETERLGFKHFDFSEIKDEDERFEKLLDVEFFGNIVQGRFENNQEVVANGLTIAYILEGEKDKTIVKHYEISVCSGVEKYSKSEGRKRALEHLLIKNFGDKLRRTEIWNLYWDSVNRHDLINDEVYSG